MSNGVQNNIGLQIGGTVGPNDKVGMHIPMPNQPGIGVSVDTNNQLIDKNVNDIILNVSGADPNSKEIKTIAREVLKERDPLTKLELVKTLVGLCSEIATIANSVYNLRHLLEI